MKTLLHSHWIMQLCWHFKGSFDTMHASILLLFNNCFPQLATYITAFLSHISPIPKSKAAARDAPLRNGREILMPTDYKVSLKSYELDVFGVYWLPAFSLASSVQKYVSSSLWAWIIVYFHKSHLTRSSWNPSDYIKWETHAEYCILSLRWRFSVVLPPVHASATWKCRNGRLTAEKPFHIAWISSKTTTVCIARSHSKFITKDCPYFFS